MMLATLIAEVERAIGPHPPERIGVAVSGGGDSMALLSVIAQYAADRNIDLNVITVDHGLRSDARHEIQVVTNMCQRLNLQHDVEFWNGWDGAGNIQSRAREARYELIADWAYAHQIELVALGHTANDQAETVLMRLARASGIDGLSAMAPRSVRHGVTWVRPFLNITRSDLRLYLQAAGLVWTDDPSNENREFERVRVRDALTVLEELGIGVQALVQVADHMRQAREALNWQTFLDAREMIDLDGGAIVIDLPRLRVLPTEIKRRMLVHCLTWLSGSIYPPRRDAVMRAIEAVMSGRTFTVEGCQLSHHGDRLWVYREFNAVSDVVAEVGDVWDERWCVDGPEDDPEIEVRALGFEALSEIENWRDRGLPRAAIAVTPAIWHDDKLVAAPIAQPDQEWTAELDAGKDAFFAALLTH